MHPPRSLKFSLLAGILAIGAAAWVPERALGSGDQPLVPTIRGSENTLRPTLSTGRATLVYDDTLSSGDIALRAEADAKRLGGKVVRTLLAAKLVVVEGSPEKIRAALAVQEDIPVLRVRDAFEAYRNNSPEDVLAVTGNALLRFRDNATEAQKSAFLARHGLRLQHETAAGWVLAKATAERTDAELIAFAEGLAEKAPELVEQSAVDLAKAGIPHGSNSLALTADTLFGQQWYMQQDGLNSPGFQTDNDIDGARLLQTRGDGSSAVIVGVFDSGTDIFHPDLDGVQLSPAGLDFVDGDNAPVGNASLFGSHGTAMASIIAAERNAIGMVGIAPASRLYHYRIFDVDFSTTTFRITQSITDATLRGLQVGNHSYALAVGQSSEQSAFKFAAQSGRENLGMLNVASAGNDFRSQYRFPGSSPYTLTATAINDSGTRVLQANYDPRKRRNVIAAPGSEYFDNDGFTATSIVSNSLGIIMADVSGVNGASTSLTSFLGGNYVSLSPSQAASVNTYVGTSFSAAMTSGVAARMFGDPRYVAMQAIDASPAPFQFPAEYLDTVAGVLQYTTDLPEPMDYPDRSSLFLGAGRLNAMNPLHPELTVPGSSAPFRILSHITATPFYEAKFGSFDPIPLGPGDDGGGGGGFEFRGGEEPPPTGPEGQNPDPEIGLRGWLLATENANGDPVAPQWGLEFDAAEGVVQNLLGPAYEPVRAKVFASEPLDEFGTEDYEFATASVVNFEDLNDERNFLYVLSDSIATTDTQTSDEKYIYNPEGRYQANTRTRNRDARLSAFGNPDEPGFAKVSGRQFAQSPLIAGPTAFFPIVPIFAEISIGFELGLANGSSELGIDNAGETATVLSEIDRISFELVPDGAASVIGRPVIFTGDTYLTRGAREVPAAARLVNVAEADEDESLYPIWTAGAGGYRPYPPEGEIVIRRFFVFLGYLVNPGAPSSTPPNFSVLMTFTPNGSILPSYEIDTGDDQDAGRPFPSTTTLPPITENAEQLDNVWLDYRGYQFESIRLFTLGSEGYPLFFPVGQTIANTGRNPDWAPSDGEAFFARETDDGKGNAIPNLAVAPIDARRINGVSEPPPPGEAYPVVPTLDLIQPSSGITGLSVHPTLAMMAYTVPQGDSGGLFFVKDDGNEELRPYPTFDAGARHTNFSPQGTFLAWNSASDVHVAGFDYLNPYGAQVVSRIVTSSNSTLANFSDAVVDFTGGYVLFSASPNNGDGPKNIYAYLRIQKIPFPITGDGANVPLLPGWEATDETDLNLSSDGRRLLFASNRTSLSDASPSDGYRIYAINNVFGVLLNGAAPNVTQIDVETGAEEPAFTSARYPRQSSGNGRIVFVTDPDEAGQGTVRWTSIPGTSGSVDPTPTPFPTATPQPTEVTPTPTPDDRVTLAGQVLFDTGNMGWEFGTAVPVLDPAIGTASGGALNIVSNDTGGTNNNTFGFYTSPSGTVARPQQGSLVMARGYLRGNAASRATQPIIRLRANSEDFQLAYTTEVNSLGDLSQVPATGGGTMDLLFEPPTPFYNLDPTKQTFRLSFDLLNFLPDDDPFGGASLSRIDIFTIRPDAVTVENVDHTNNLDSSELRSRFSFGTAPTIAPAIGSTSATGLRIAATRADENFGFWSSNPGTVFTTDTGNGIQIYRLTGVLASNVEPNSGLNPDMRIRINTADFQRNSVSVVNTTMPANISPFPGRPLNFTSFLVLNSPLGTDEVILSFDLTAFAKPAVTEAPVEVDSFLLERLTIQGYPPLP